MKLLELYILRRILQMFLVALVPVLTIIWTIQVLGRINLVTDTGQSMGSFMQLASYILPTIIPVVLPFAFVIGITQTLTAMNNDSELPVIDAAGAARSIIYKPVILLAVALSLVSFTITNFIEPKSRLGAREMVAAAYADLLSSVIEEKTFRSIEDGLYVQISERHSGRVLKGLFIVDYRDPNFGLIYYAREGSVDPGGTSLTMRDGEVHRKGPDGRISIVKFASYAFDLSAMTQSDEGGLPLYSGDRPLSFLLNPDKTDPAYQKKPESFRSELHRRLSDWLFPITFALVSLLVAGNTRSHRSARLHPMIYVLLFAFLLRWLGFSATNLTERNAAYVPLVYAIPLVTCLVTGFMLATNRQIQMPRLFSRSITKATTVVQKRLSPTGRGTTGEVK
ncbi:MULTISPECIES: LptF/LptG family permease [Rhizobium/Agrobacterium group]|jgi:lipopolysaccharide export system permease protein|uniref:Lipopolysaccharide export system permease protein n=1 Tax=Rhizobium soli TaxID=424798 RepID=A0A7X0JKE2_9HYPH|nr:MULTISPECIES: LptF/LptG family permease [Rhizobium/Agrobacterium group]RYE69630.1 MAG: LptF/LptG family permease [Rhizobiaceae bacterium]KQQ37715.1 LPS export ABC transporter permease LptF [Rhizobium sp. Leaf306]MBB6509218.1 lipopolysaccharide export system permease protein [Rhizobium soli]MBD8663630.1 LptF/LptG family permease [Rhizobium sp. CFBP 8752]MBP2460651.1 lipopolysaccharide export system permease protein [Rhizobium sp. PvP014]